MNYNRLTQKARLQARELAIEAVGALSGKKPRIDDYRNTQISAYPSWISNLVVGLALIVLLTSFTLSAMRLYHIGSLTFRESIAHDNAGIVAGIAIVLLSESASVLFLLALSIIGHSPTQRGILLASTGATAMLALSGNYYVALSGHPITLFTILEAMLPPLLVLSTAYVLKELLLNTISARHADNQAYQAALSAYELATRDPENHEQFAQAYANAIFDALIKANRKDDVRGWLHSLSPAVKSQIVLRELKQDTWFDTAIDEDTTETLALDDSIDDKASEDFLALNGVGKS